MARAINLICQENRKEMGGFKQDQGERWLIQPKGEHCCGENGVTNGQQLQMRQILTSALEEKIFMTNTSQRILNYLFAQQNIPGSTFTGERKTPLWTWSWSLKINRIPDRTKSGQRTVHKTWGMFYFGCVNLLLVLSISCLPSSWFWCSAVAALSPETVQADQSNYRHLWRKKVSQKGPINFRGAFFEACKARLLEICIPFI